MNRRFILFFVILASFVSALCAEEKSPPLQITIREQESAFPYLILSPDLRIELKEGVAAMNIIAVINNGQEAMLGQILAKGYVPARPDAQAALKAALVKMKIGDKNIADRIRAVSKLIGKPAVAIAVIKRPETAVKK